MTFTKNMVRGIVVDIILLVLFTVITFAIPFPITAALIMAYVFGLAAILLQLAIQFGAFYKNGVQTSKFYGFPIAKIGLVYCVIQLIVSLVVMALGFVWACPVWIPLVVSVILLAAALVGTIAADAVRDEVVRQGEQLKKDVSAMRTMQAQVASLAARTGSKEIEKLSDAFRFSDPVSSDMTYAAEAKLSEMLAELAQTKDETLCPAIMDALEERNALCGAGKRM